MGPYGPVYHFILLLYEFYVLFTLFLYVFRWFYTHVLTCLTDFENSCYTYFITFLDCSNDNFASPPAPEFGLLCNCDFPICFNWPEHFLIFYIIDFRYISVISWWFRKYLMCGRSRCRAPPGHSGSSSISCSVLTRGRGRALRHTHTSPHTSSPRDATTPRAQLSEIYLYGSFSFCCLGLDLIK